MAVTRVTAAPLHHPRRHAAVRTDEYVFAQLIPYIGNKRRLLHLIDEAIESTGRTSGTLVDLFTGSTVVARHAKQRGWRVIANDWEPYSAELARATVALNATPDFSALGDVDRVFDTLNNLPPLHGYVATHLCPADDDAPDPTRERLFFTRANGARIDAIREQVDAWEQTRRIDADGRAFIVAALLYAASYASNTSGVFKGFHHGWGGRTGTALYRILAPLRIVPPTLHDNGLDNLALREDAAALAPRLRDVAGVTPDIVYLDPPYNQHPYGSNYHVLNTVTLWDKPALNPCTVVDGRTVEKAAIRKDWRTERRSAYNSAAAALPALETLVGAIDAHWILMSYSTDGNIPVPDVLRAFAARGTVRVFLQRYKRYRVSSTRPSARSHTAEFVVAVDTSRRATPASDVEAMTETIARAVASNQ